jgi:cysteine desulfurase
VATEHSSILDPCLYLERLGFTITRLPVDLAGLIDLEKLKTALRPDTVLVSIMAANNEIGVLQPLEEIGRICKAHDILFHSDAAQAIGKIPLDVQQMQLDLMSITAHKIYGPKGVGALYLRRKNPRVELIAQMQGGGQERGLRPGTVNLPLIVGLARALELSLHERSPETERLTELRNQLWQGLNKRLDRIHLNGHLQQRLANNLNISIEGVDGNLLISALQSRIAISSGSACASAYLKPSHVLKALGRSDQLARASLRFGLGRFNSAEQIKQTESIVVETVLALRKA